MLHESSTPMPKPSTHGPSHPPPKLTKSRAGSKRAVADVAYVKSRMAKDCPYTGGNN